MPTPVMIELEASLECELDGKPVFVSASRGTVVVNVGDPQMVWTLVRIIRRIGTLRSTITAIDKALVATSQRLEFRVDDVVVVSMGHGIESGILRWAGLERVRIWPMRLLRR